MRQTIAYLIVAACVTVMLSSCTLSVGPDNRPVIGVDPAAIAKTVALWQAKHGSKNATVLILAPDGKPITEVPKPSP